LATNTPTSLQTTLAGEAYLAVILEMIIIPLLIMKLLNVFVLLQAAVKVSKYVLRDISMGVTFLQAIYITVLYS
jgi:L-cystine uptake protein TcyP (sodium:dicarboxylate symporter family)